MAFLIRREYELAQETGHRWFSYIAKVSGHAREEASWGIQYGVWGPAIRTSNRYSFTLPPFSLA